MNGNAASLGYRYIVRQEGVRSGQAIIVGTRIGVHDVIGLLQNGETVDTIASRCFPTISRAQVYECLAYYEDHRGEIDLLVARQMSAGTPSHFYSTRMYREDIEFSISAPGHTVFKLREVLPITASDEDLLRTAAEGEYVLITCTRDDFLALA